MNDEEIFLSESGAQRRESMLDELKLQVVTIHRKRQRRKIWLTGSISALSLSCILLWATLGGLMPRHPRATNLDPIQSVLPIDRASIGDDVNSPNNDFWVFSEPDLHLKYVVHSSDLPPPNVEYLDDAEFAALYAQSGRPGFVAIVRGKAVVLADEDEESIIAPMP